MSVPPLFKSALLAVPMALTACTATTVRPARRLVGEAETPSTATESEDRSMATPASAKSSVPSPARMDETDQKGLLDTLLENGALTDEQYERLSANEADEIDESATVSMGSGGFKVKSADGESSIKIGGRVQVDVSRHTQSGVPDQDITDGSELRRARLEMQGSLPNDLLWTAQMDFANNVTRLKDFWVGRRTDNGPGVYFGHQKQPFSLEVEMSSNDIPFIERGVDVFLLAPFVDRAVGLRVEDNTDNVFYAIGAYGQSVSPVPLDVSLDDEGWGVTGRVVFAPILSDDQVLHLGLRGSYREPQVLLGGSRIRDETTNMSNFRVLDTGPISDVKSALLYGPELVFASGPWSVGGEYTALQLQRDGDGEEFNFSGWHAQATYSLTGESLAKSYRISAGEFKRLKAESGRAWELAARVANLDLNDGSISGGSEDVSSLGLNCYYSKNLRLMLNWSHIFNTSGGSANTALAQGLDFFTFRAQLNF